MKTEYIFVALGAALATWAQIFLGDNIYGRIFLTAAGIAIAGFSYELAKKTKKGGK